MIDYPRFPISEKQFQSWKVNFKTEVCSKSAVPHLTVHWIKEVETAKSVDDLMTLRSITERTDFSDYDMLDAMIASALKKLLTHVHFRKRVSVEEQRAQKYDRFLRGRETAYMIDEHFRATRAYEAVQGLSDLFNLRLQNDNVPDFEIPQIFVHSECHRLPGGLERFADSNSIPENQPTTFHPRSFFYSAYRSFSNTIRLSKFCDSMINLHKDLPNSKELSLKMTFGFSDGSRIFRKVFSVS